MLAVQQPPATGQGVRVAQAAAKSPGLGCDVDTSGVRATDFGLTAATAQRLYESGRSTVSVRVPDDAAARFSDVVAAAEAILRAATEPSAPPVSP